MNRRPSSPGRLQWPLGSPSMMTPSGFSVTSDTEGRVALRPLPPGDRAPLAQLRDVGDLGHAAGARGERARPPGPVHAAQRKLARDLDAAQRGGARAPLLRTARPANLRLAKCPFCRQTGESCPECPCAVGFNPVRRVLTLLFRVPAAPPRARTQRPRWSPGMSASKPRIASGSAGGCGSQSSPPPAPAGPRASNMRSV